MSDEPTTTDTPPATEPPAEGIVTTADTSGPADADQSAGPGTVTTGSDGQPTYTPTYDEAIAAGYSPDAAKAMSTAPEPPSTAEPAVPDPMTQDSPVATFPDTVPPAGLPGDFGEVKDPANEPPEPKVFSTADMGGNPPPIVDRDEGGVEAAAEADAEVADDIAATAPVMAVNSAAAGQPLTDTERKIREQTASFAGESATERKLREMGLTDAR